jgi:hypothetical protein
VKNPWVKFSIFGAIKLLPLHHGGGVGDLGEGRDATEDESSNVFPSNLCRFSFYFVVLCFLPPPCENASGFFI